MKNDLFLYESFIKCRMEAGREDENKSIQTIRRLKVILYQKHNSWTTPLFEYSG